ncbi:hypothetical protein ACJIZ3_008057 [Penstemon smallii]|uniref:AP2/ERF domain-containing protein n=1 Tax=Penstemon smallii TaxID=265156 RepID=A0ABD3T9L3_9LAMI
MECGGGASEVGRGGGGGRGGAATRRRSDKPYKGIRMRKWGKWVAEIREPNKRSRIWLGSYSTAVAAARAYDTAVYYLRGPTAKLNFPEEISAAGVGPKDLSAASIRKKAAEVGARVDALQINSCFVAANHEIDLNKEPEPEDPTTLDYW